MEAKPFQPTTGTLIGRFEKQRWAGDRAEEIETVEFDATDYILNMSAAGLRKVEDCNYSSDAMAKLMWTTRAHFQFTSNKPSVQFFGVEAVSDIKSTHLRQAKAWLKSLPKKQYIARVSLHTYLDLPITAQHPSQVQTLALRHAKTLMGKTAYHVEFLSSHCCN